MSEPFKLLLDPGHGGPDWGAVHEKTGLREAHVAYDVATKLASICMDNSLYEVRITRRRDQFVSLQKRADIANEWPSDLFLSIHCNSAERSGANGYEVFTSPGRTDSDFAAKFVYEAWERKFPRRTGRKLKEAPFTVLTATKGVAMLFELEFIHNDVGAAFLRDPNLQGQMAEALYNGIEDYREFRWPDTAPGLKLDPFAPVEPADSYRVKLAKARSLIKEVMDSFPAD